MIRRPDTKVSGPPRKERLSLLGSREVLIDAQIVQVGGAGYEMVGVAVGNGVGYKRHE
jgi:hypothetical protein